MARKYYHFLRNHHVPLEGVETPPGMIEVMLSIIGKPSIPKQREVGC